LTPVQAKIAAAVIGPIPGYVCNLSDASERLSSSRISWMSSSTSSILWNNGNTLRYILIAVSRAGPSN
jgi:hypothetical protein